MSQVGVRDWFAVLGVSRRAALDPGEVAERFREVGAGLHPDAAEGDGSGDGRFEDANEARRVLASAPDRLRHLLELEFGDGAVGRGGAVGDGVMALFTQVGEAVESARALASKRQGARTELAKALLAGETAKVQQAVSAALAAVRGEVSHREQRLPEVDALLESDRDAARETGGDLYRELAFLARWESQLQAAFASLF